MDEGLNRRRVLSAIILTSFSLKKKSCDTIKTARKLRTLQQPNKDTFKQEAKEAPSCMVILDLVRAFVNKKGCRIIQIKGRIEYI